MSDSLAILWAGEPDGGPIEPGDGGYWAAGYWTAAYWAPRYWTKAGADGGPPPSGDYVTIGLGPLAITRTIGSRLAITRTVGSTLRVF